MLQWIDKEGKTPLILACLNSQFFDVAQTLIELGANVNAYRPGMPCFILLLNCQILIAFSVSLSVCVFFNY